MDTLSGRLSYNAEGKEYACEGDWVIHTVNKLREQSSAFTLPSNEKITLCGKSLKQFDSAGALCLFKFINCLKDRHNVVTLKNFSQVHHDLFNIIQEKKGIYQYKPPPPEEKGMLYDIGVEAVKKLSQGKYLITIIGDLTTKIVSATHHLRRFHFPSIVSTIYDTGVTALPIVGLLSFLIGVVLAYQMGLQLETYGANIFIAYLSGMAIFREFAPLITAILVAGRTSSAFTAQIGSMKLNEEIDALHTMGLSPTELLVLPRVIGLLIVFPLLIFWSAGFAIIGAMIMAKSMLSVGHFDFLHRIQQSVGFQQLALGLYKAPTFALLIAIVGCLQGLLVQANADSIGRQTTKSVVQALFLIIIADAVYSVIYSWLDV